MNTEIIQPEGWSRPRGYSNGLVAEGRVLAIGGQIGWNAQQVFEHLDFVGQFGQTLANIRAVLDAAGARPEHIIKMTVYVTDLDAYRASLTELGPLWKQHIGRWYPAMALVGVTGLVEPEAMVEIETLAILPAKETP
jgi:enamine deaminase RidA (YjgF/YER057c/UK114 family)